MSQYMFGTGSLFVMPVGGGAPLRVGALQDVSFDISFDTKMLHGQSMFALDVARGKAKAEGKMGTANIDSAAFNQIVFGKTLATGSKKQAVNEAGTVASNTITSANSGANFFMDLGVFYAATGLPLLQVAAGAEVTGKYSVSATGVYTFAAGDNTKAMLLNYLYTDASNGGTLSLTNDYMGSAPMFQLVASQVYKNKNFVLCLYSVIADKLSFPLKQDAHTISEISYSAQDNGTGTIGFFSTTSAAGGGA